MEVIEQLEAALETPMPGEEGSIVRNVEALRRTALFLAKEFLCGCQYVVECKSAAEYDERQFVQDEAALAHLAGRMVKAREEFPEKEREQTFTFIREMLTASGKQYFDILGMAFDTRKISACHFIFTAVVQGLGEREAIEQTAALVEARRAMCRAINALAFKADVSKQLEAINNKQNDVMAKVDTLMTKAEEAEKDHIRFDRRQSEFLHLIKRWIKGLIALFRPGAPAPDDQQVQNTLMPISKYACLQRISYPHNMQIKAVIDHTWNVRPIDHKSGRKNREAYSLAFAARDVWAKMHNDWDRISGTFKTSKDLYSACNHLQGKVDDPFHYKTAQ